MNYTSEQIINDMYLLLLQHCVQHFRSGSTVQIFEQDIRISINLLCKKYSMSLNSDFHS